MNKKYRRKTSMELHTRCEIDTLDFCSSKVKSVATSLVNVRKYEERRAGWLNEKP